MPKIKLLCVIKTALFLFSLETNYFIFVDLLIIEYLNHSIINLMLTNLSRSSQSKRKNRDSSLTKFPSSRKIPKDFFSNKTIETE